MKNTLTLEQKKMALENFLNLFDKEKKYFIYSVNLGKNVKFSVAEKSKPCGVNPKSNFMTYDEMNCYFMGILAVKENRINF